MKSKKLKVKTENSKVKTKKSNLKRENERFENRKDLRKRCYFFSIEIIRLIESINPKRVYFSILDQLLRSATSVGANIIEAKSAGSKRDFIKFYQIALKSANETKYWLCLLRDGLKIDKETIAPLLKEAEEIASIIAASLLTLKSKND